MDDIIKVYLAFLVLMSFVSFFLYGLDKRRAKRGKWRIKESTLMAVGLLGGAAGSLLGMKMFRHKTRHTYFYVANTLFLVSHIVLLGYLFLNNKRKTRKTFSRLSKL